MSLVSTTPRFASVPALSASAHASPLAPVVSSAGAAPSAAASPHPAPEPHRALRPREIPAAYAGPSGFEERFAPAAPLVPASAPKVPLAVPAFITPASLITVSGGTAAVSLMWGVAKVLAGPGRSLNSPWIPFVFSLLVGGAIYLLSINDQEVQATRREKIIGGFIGFLNSMVLFAANIGILAQH